MDRDLRDLVPVQRITSAQSVAHQILDMIRRGVWKAGDQLPTEKELLDKLAVGRSTIREALQILATLNVIQATPGHGTFVKSPSATELFRPEVVGVLIGDPVALHLLEVREMIEPACARLAAIRGKIADFDAVERVLDDHESAYRAGRPVKLHGARFHVQLVEASGNKVAASLMTSILGILTERGSWVEGRPAEQRLEIDEHREILTAVRSRDPDRAADIMQRHIVSWAAIYVTEGLPAGKSLLEAPLRAGASR
jgi:DNA-binding FadR family transcriptional regulator